MHDEGTDLDRLGELVSASLANSADPSMKDFAHGVRQWFAETEAADLDEHRAFYESFPIHGLVSCFRWGLAVPDWLAAAFVSSYDQVMSGNAKGWDEVFGKMPPRRSVEKLETKFAAVEAAHFVMAANPAHAIDKLFWEQVGERIGRSDTQAENLYREAVAEGLAPAPLELKARMKGS